MKEFLCLYAMALDSGYLSLADLIAWADSQVLQLATPPRWLLDLCTARSQEESSNILLMESYRYLETIGCECPYDAHHDDLYLGFLYYRFERGDLTMAELLSISGQYSDTHGCGIPCEIFYMTLNEIDGGGPTIPSNEPLEIRVANLFAPMMTSVRQHMGKLSETESHPFNPTTN